MNRTDQLIVRSLAQRITAFDPDWTFHKRDVRTGAHGLIRYPAMMVPGMQNELLGAVLRAVPGRCSVLDPFVGSGTALSEALALGCDFTGTDINPLAVLISKVKAGPFDVALLKACWRKIDAWIAADRLKSYAVSFHNQQKWFSPANSIALSKIRRAVEKIEHVHVRRFFWVAVAETIRLASNSRTSTYKLHVRKPEEILQVNGVVLRTFRKIVARNIGLFEEEVVRLKCSNRLSGSMYSGSVDVKLQDVRDLGQHQWRAGSFDVLLSSPPYGDNRTTVPYGQYSYLALQWIPAADIDSNSHFSYEGTNTLDANSLGGKLKGAARDAKSLADRSPNFAKALACLKSTDDSGNAANRWAAYCRDLDTSITQVAKKIRKDGYLMWTIGERRIHSITVPLVKVIGDLHLAAGAVPVHAISRRIPSKRLPQKNNAGALMVSETICIFRMAR